MEPTPNLDVTRPRPRCSVFIATSLDGYIARADGGLEWLDMVSREGVDYGFQEFFDSVDCMVMGRGTYDAVIGFPEWPYSPKRQIVLTHRPAASKHGEEFFAGEPGPLLDRLAQEGVRHVYVDGGNVIQQFLRTNLIDELTVSLIPIVLGGGIRLFAGGEHEHPLELMDHQAWESGLVQVRYRVRRSG